MEVGDRMPRSLAAAALEALIAAIYLDGGFDTARDFILRNMNREIDEAVKSEHQFNFKSQLQQYAQRVKGLTPSYELLDEKGPDHAKCFEVAVSIGSRYFPSAWGPSKKEAEQKAAWLALVALGELKDDRRMGRAVQRPLRREVRSQVNARPNGAGLVAGAFRSSGPACRGRGSPSERRAGLAREA
jgi:hypothetical protein